MDAASFCITALCCMSLNLYHECRNCDLLEQLAIYSVVNNRVADPRFPDDVCEVVYEVNHVPQFSWYGDGDSDLPRNSKAWARMERIVKNFRRSRLGDPTGGSVCYHRSDVEGWECEVDYVDIGYHRFYRPGACDENC